MSPERIAQTHEAQSGDVIAYTIGEPGTEDFDVAVAGGENTVPDTSTARAILAGELVVLQGVIEFDGADAALNFALPAEIAPLLEESLLMLHVDGGVNTVAVAVIGPDGVVVVTPAAAFAAGDELHLSGSYLRA